MQTIIKIIQWGFWFQANCSYLANSLTICKYQFFFPNSNRFARVLCRLHTEIGPKISSWNAKYTLLKVSKYKWRLSQSNNHHTLIHTIIQHYTHTITHTNTITWVTLCWTSNYDFCNVLWTMTWHDVKWVSFNTVSSISVCWVFRTRPVYFKPIVNASKRTTLNIVK